MLVTDRQTDRQTGYPSVDKPWLKYYSAEAINEPLPKLTLYEYLYQSNKEHVDSNALDYFGKKMTYGQLFNEIEKASKAFMALGVKPKEIVSIVSVSNVVSIICLYALNRIGAVANYVNVLASEQELAKYFKEASSNLVVTLDLFGNKVLTASKNANVETIVTFSLSEYMPRVIGVLYKHKIHKVDMSFKEDSMVLNWNRFIKNGKDIEEILYQKSPKDLCFLGHTGGTTGFPKGVLLNDIAMNAVAHQYKLSMEHKTGEKFLNCIIPFVVYGILTCMHMPLCLGLEVVVIPKFEASDWKKILTKIRPVHIAGIPSYVIPMLEDDSLKSIDMSFIKTLAVGGDGMNDKLEIQLNAFLANHNAKTKITKGYGMTEVCATAVTEYSYCNKEGSVGIPLAKNNLLIYDNDNNVEMKYNQVGEVCINSPSLLMNYQNNTEEYNQLVRIHKDGKKWVHTGDLGYITEDGLLFLAGRMKRMIFLGPEGMLYKVFPKTIEEIINNIEGVRDSCVVSKEIVGRLVATAFIITSVKDIDTSDLKEKIISECSMKMPEYMIPQEIEFLEQFPLTVVGKVDFKKLEEVANGN